MIDISIIKVPPYSYLKNENKHLFGELEANTYKLRVLKEQSIDVSELKERRAFLKDKINHNMELLELAMERENIL